MIARLLLFLISCVLLSGSPALAQNAVREAFAAAEDKKWDKARDRAAASGNITLEKLIFWQYALDRDSSATFNEISNFLVLNPDWPEQKRLRIRAELALREGAAHEDIFHWFSREKPLTGYGKIALARALLIEKPDDEKTIRALVKDAWLTGDFDDMHEKDILSSFRSMLTQDDHIARTDRLLWDGMAYAADRMLPLLPDAHDKLVKARLSLQGFKRLSVVWVSRVPDKLKNDPGLIYDRMQYKAKRRDNEGVREMLLAAPSTLPYPDKWWPARELQTRLLIDGGEYGLAEKILSGHGDLGSRYMADAAWLHGWLQLEFLKKPDRAYPIFANMHESVSYPVSLGRAAYWAGRAAEAQGKKDIADRWYEKAAKHSTTFYGQLAALKRTGSAPLDLSNSTDDNAKQPVNSELLQAVRLCLDNDAPDLAKKLMGFIIEEGSPRQILDVLRIAQDSEYPYLAVSGGKKAMQQGVLDVATSYPQITTPGSIAVERPLVLAVARQESEFDPHATSPAGARGLIQLMPGTAKETARKLGLTYDKKKLFEPEYNLTIGSNYLSRMIENYDGSYVMAIAAYNAGPGNVRKWTRAFGTPGNDFEGAIRWCEQIPFAETRNYVQRVMENLQVYRHLEGNAPRLMLAEDLVR